MRGAPSPQVGQRRKGTARTELMEHEPGTVYDVRASSRLVAESDTLRVTIPAQVCRALGIEPKQPLRIAVDEANGAIIIYTR